jgi:hypothetical protein
MTFKSLGRKNKNVKEMQCGCGFDVSGNTKNAQGLTLLYHFLVVGLHFYDSSPFQRGSQSEVLPRGERMFKSGGYYRWMMA